MKKLTQRQTIFYQLYNNWRNGEHEYIPIFKFMGEVHCVELDVWGFVSNEVSSRMSELNSDNPYLLEYIESKARAGSMYRCWRIKKEIYPTALVDKSIIKLHSLLKRHEQNSKPIEYCSHRIPKGALCPDCPKVVHSIPTSVPRKPYVD